jgi:hypothetical protein
MITLNAKWTACHMGITFPVGTVFIPQRTICNRGTVYAYGTPDGGHGEVLLCVGIVPGVDR